MQIVAALAALTIAASARAQDITIDCDAGASIGEVLADKARKGKPLTLRVRGTCHENLLIGRDDVTLEGEGAGAGIAGSVTVDAARRVVVSKLNVTNPLGDGVSVVNGASAVIRDSTIVDNGGHGLVVRHASFAIVERNTLSRNGRATPGSGIFLAIGSTARGEDNRLEDNTGSGIEVGDSSNYRSEGDEATMRAGSTAALDIYRAGFADLRRASVIGSVNVNQQSQLQVRNVGDAVSTVAGHIAVSGLSFLRLRSGVVRSGTLNCVTGSFAVCVIDP